MVLPDPADHDPEAIFGTELTFDLPDISTPIASEWWDSGYITGIPEHAVGWMLSQGWQITAVVNDTTTRPYTSYYTMTKDVMNHHYVLQDMLNRYTVAYNDARWANQERYNAVVENWLQMFSDAQDYQDYQIDEQNAHATLFLANLDTYMDEVDTLIDDITGDLETSLTTAGTALSAMNSKLSELETNADANAVTVGTLLTNQSTYLTTFLSDFTAALDEFYKNYCCHLTNMNTLLTASDTDMSTFASSQSTQLSAIASAYTTLVSDLGTLLTAADADLTTVESAINTVLSDTASDFASLDTELDALLASGTTALASFDADYANALAKLEPDYTDQEIITENLLEGLGVTEVARIREQFAASLSQQIQDLVDRGLYSSAVVTDITQRNHRDRDEQLQKHYDYLNREKLGNRHKLYGQQQSMRDRTMAGTERLHNVKAAVYQYQAAQKTGVYELLQATRQRTLDAKTKIYALQDANSRLHMQTKTQLYELGQAMRVRLIDEAARLQQLEQAVTQWQASQRDKLLAQIQEVEAITAQGVEKQHAAKQEVSRIAMQERDTLLAQLQDAIKAFITGKERFAAQTAQNADILARAKQQVVVAKMNEAATRLEGQRGVHADNMKLMAYLLNEKNQLLIGLYGFIERREDIGPSFSELTQVAAALGDSGSGWVSP